MSTTEIRCSLLVAGLGALLSSACAHGTLVTSTPPGATVTVGDDVVGVTPIEVRPTREPIRVEAANAITTFTMSTELDGDAAALGVSLAALAWASVLAGAALYIVATWGAAALGDALVMLGRALMPTRPHRRDRDRRDRDRRDRDVIAM